MGRRLCDSTLVSLALALALADVAGAQVRLRADGGYIGRETGTEEVEECDLDDLDADTRSRLAAEHYDRGETLYKQAEYEGSIEEFVAAYCHAPHYKMLYNIGQSYERRLEYEKAIAFFERYILETPRELEEEREKVSFRVQVLRSLPARIRVATVPPRAQVTLRDDAGVSARAVANDEAPIEVHTGTYTMTVEAPGYEPVTETIRPRIGQPYSYYFRLEPKKGTLRIAVNPAGARIFVDRRLVGLGSYVEQVPIGAYEITVEAPERQPETRRVEVTAGQTTGVRIELAEQPRSGRRDLIIASTLGGGVFGGSAFGTIFSSDASYASLGGLLGLGIGFAGGYYGVSSDIPVGSSSYIIGTTLIGAAEGAAISSFFLCDSTIGDSGSISTRCNDKGIASITLASGIAGLGFAAATHRRFRFDAGDAAIINSGALWGSVAGGLFYVAFDADHRARAPLLFAGLNLGLVTGVTLATRYEVSRGHVALIDLGGLAGMVAGVALTGLVDEAEAGGDTSERLPHFALGGMTVGLIVASYLTRDMDDPSIPVLGSVQPAVTSVRDQRGRDLAALGLTGRF